MHTYEVGIYNRFIREKVRDGEIVGKNEAKWEDVHYFDIKAKNETEVEKKIRMEYSKLLGFEIECINKYRD
jgi:hypothetical protein|tara:strand:+ start:283 stop:495 length:213 start_codon:yes stop_codon:yes gene_type:complete